jgi:hypothetical protein
MEKLSNAYKNLIGKTERKRLLGKSRHDGKIVLKYILRNTF